MFTFGRPAKVKHFNRYTQDSFSHIIYELIIYIILFSYNYPVRRPLGIFLQHLILQLNWDVSGCISVESTGMWGFVPRFEGVALILMQFEKRQRHCPRWFEDALINPRQEPRHSGRLWLWSCLTLPNAARRIPYFPSRRECSRIASPLSIVPLRVTGWKELSPWINSLS